MVVRGLLAVTLLGLPFAWAQETTRLYRDSSGGSDLRVRAESGAVIFRTRSSPEGARSVWVIIPSEGEKPLELELKATPLGEASTSRNVFYKTEIPESQRLGFPLFKQSFVGIEVRIPLGRKKARTLKLKPVERKP